MARAAVVAAEAGQVGAGVFETEVAVPEGASRVAGALPRAGSPDTGAEIAQVRLTRLPSETWVQMGVKRRRACHAIR